MKKTGYKGMLRDRVSVMSAVDLALKYCKAKTRWVDHVYDSFIGIYKNNKERDRATRIVLGIRPKTNSKNHKKYNRFDFHTTIDWDNLSTEDKNYWTTIESWVTWFQNYIPYIEQSIKQGYSDSHIKQKFNVTEYDDLIEYIRKSI